MCICICTCVCVQTIYKYFTCTCTCRYKTSQELISHDVHSNTYNYKFTFSVEIVPVCRDNVVCLPRRVANALGNIRLGETDTCTNVYTCTVHPLHVNVYFVHCSPLVICSKVNSSLQVIDPTNLQGIDNNILLITAYVIYDN